MEGFLFKSFEALQAIFKKTLKSGERKPAEASRAESKEVRNEDFQLSPPYGIRTSADEIQIGVRKSKWESQTSASKVIRIRPVVGFDFGTSTFKCVVKVVVPGQADSANKRVISFGASDGLLPSCCWGENGLIFVDAPARGRRLIENIKTHARQSIEGKAIDSELTGGVAPIPLAWALMSFGVRKCRDWLVKEYPAGRFTWGEEDLSWNMGAPIDGQQDRRLSETMATLLWMAVHRPFEWDRQGHRPEEILAAFELAYAGAPKAEAGASWVTMKCGTNCWIFPEALAAMNGFVQETEQGLEDGYYLVADMGAGTTDFCAFYYFQHNVTPISIYTSRSVPIGMRLYEEAIREHSDEGRGDIIRRLMAHSLGQVRTRAALLVNDYSRAVLDQINQAARVDRNYHRWRRDLKGLALLGGGGLYSFSKAMNKVKMRSPLPEAELRLLPLRPMAIPGFTPFHFVAMGLANEASLILPAWSQKEIVSHNKAENMKRPGTKQVNPSFEDYLEERRQNPGRWV
jgi:hypothetical protein